MSLPENKKPEIEKSKKESYSPPKILFIPLKVEEQLMLCGKEEGEHCAPLKFS
ncbi:MAG: hypothetical protein WC644_07920 [Ignavibacteria bacterium]